MKNTEIFLTLIQQYNLRNRRVGAPRTNNATRGMCVYTMSHSPDVTVLKVKMKMHQTRFLGSLLSHCFVSCVSCAHITNSSAAGDVVYVSVGFLSWVLPSSCRRNFTIIVNITGYYYYCYYISWHQREHRFHIVIDDIIELHLLQHPFTKKVIFIFMNFLSPLIFAVLFLVILK